MARILAKVDRRCGCDVFAVAFLDRQGRDMVTGWTRYAGEAAAWLASAEAGQWVTSGRPGPMMPECLHGVREVSP